MIKPRFVWRQLTSARRQAVLFVLCVALSMVTLVSLRSFSDSVNRTLRQDARELQAADIIVSSNIPLSETLQQAIDRAANDPNISVARLYEFITIVRTANDDDSLLSSLKVVEPGYPFYGEVELASGAAFANALQPGQIIVGQGLLERLGLQVGDPLNIGETTLTIAGVVLSEPDRPVDFFTLGPRIFIAAADLEALNLIKPGSRVSYTTLLQVRTNAAIDSVAADLQRAAAERESVETYRTADSVVKIFLDNFLFFISLIGIFTLLLAGIGTQSALTAYLKEKEGTIAVLKTLGATSQFILRNYLIVVALFGLVGTVLGLLLGLALQGVFPYLFANFLPDNVALVISANAIAQSFVLGFFVVGAFTFLPLYQLQDLKPRFIFRKEVVAATRGWPFYVTIGFIFTFFVGLVLWQLQDIAVGLWFAFGVVILILLTSLITEGALRLLRRRRIKALALRQAFKGLFRPRNATRAVIITLAASLAVIFTIYLIEQNLNASFVESYPDDAPNVVFLDIQPDQVDTLNALLPTPASFFPVVRADIIAVNGTPIDAEGAPSRRGPPLSRTFNLSYSDALAANEQLIAGETLFDPAFDGVQVSILENLSEFYDFQLGDQITFRVQGVPLPATITSIRASTEQQENSFRPSFEFLFPPDVLTGVPQSIFTAIRLAPSQIPALQTQVVAALPNVTVINISAAINTFAAVLNDLTVIIRFFTLFSITAGLLIIVSSVFATRFARIQEAVYFKVLGAKSRFVLAVFTLENLLLGFISATLALLMSQIGSWLIIRYAFELDYQPHLGATLLLVLGTMLLVTMVGMLASVSILRHKPITFLREQSQE